VWLRDPQSAAMLASTGFPGPGVTADSVIMMRPDQPPPETARGRTLGLCISTQRQVADLDGVRGMVAAVRASGGRVTGIPMNPKTDRALLERLGVECIGGTEPEDVIAAAAKCDVVLSSRLHLLILAANAGTPILGIARGSKLANWPANFGREVEGSGYDCDWKKVTEHVMAELDGRHGDWLAARDAAYARLDGRFAKARAEFAEKLEACRG
jgi:polysaccharide pyruvyl transferase WcaK-like protein